jgi:hypothetical protein
MHKMILREALFILLSSAIIMRMHARSTPGLELVAYTTDRDHHGLSWLQHSARWNGWRPLHVIGTQEGFDSHGLVDKLRALRRFARKWQDDTILVFVDGYDVVVNNAPAQLESAFLASGRRVLLASELGCCADKATAMAYGSTCHPNWPFTAAAAGAEADFQGGRKWLNSGVMVGYARDVRRLLKRAWKEYLSAPLMYRAYTDQQVLCHLLSEGTTLWTRAAVGIDHASEVALTTYQTNIRLEGDVLGLDSFGRIVFSNRTIPTLIHFNGPKQEKERQMAYAKANFPALSGVS